MMSLPFFAKLRRLKGSERGLTLTELLVTMGLLVLVAGVSLAILLSTVASSSRFGQNTANQTEVAHAIAVINRDVMSASSVDYAASNALALTSTEDTNLYNVKLFGYNPSKSNNGLPSDFAINTSKLPNFPALIEQRTNKTTNAFAQTVLVPGWTSDNQSTSLFTYYDSSDSQLQPPANGSLAAGTNVVRIEFFIAAKVSDRSSNIELAGSATVHSLGVLGVGTTQDPQFNQVPDAPPLTVTLKERETTAHLSWVAVNGATSYTISRKENNGPYGVLKVIGNPDTLSYDDVNPGGSAAATLGNSYTYYITALGSGGPSDPSRPARMVTAVPPKVTIINVNSNGSLASGSTVARGLTNQITWSPVNGATGYYVFRDNSNTPIFKVSSGTTSVQETPQYDQANGITPTLDYGQSHTYRIEAYNQNTYNCNIDFEYPQPGLGICDGVISDPVKLISPPTAPTINVVNAQVADRDSTPYNVITLTSASSSEAISGYNLYRNGVGGAAANCNALTDTGQTLSGQGSSVNNVVSWNEGDCYGVYAYNDAGFSPVSNKLRAYQGPSSFNLVNVSTTAGLGDSANGSLYTVARGNTNQLAWNASYGAEGYDIYRGDGTYITTVDSNTRSWREGNNNGDTRSYYVRAFVDWNNDAPAVTNDSSLINRDNGANVRKEIQTGTVSLVAPPTAPNITATANDDSTTSKSVNYVTVNSRGTNAATVTIYRNQTTLANPSCSTSNGALTTNAGSSNSDGNANWGSSTCYVAQAFNDAGGSGPGNSDVADQLPGKFSVSSGTNDTRWFKLSNSSQDTDDFQKSDQDSHTSNPNIDLNYDISWTGSAGSAFYDNILGYLNDNPSSSRRVEGWSSNGYGTCNGNNSALMNAWMPASGSGIAAAGSTTCRNGDSDRSTSTTYNNMDTSLLSPGSYYRMVVISVGTNGQRRGNAASFTTSPAQPRFVGSFIYEKASIGQCGRRVASVGASTAYGTADTVNGKVNYSSDPDPKDYASKGSVNSSSTGYLGIYSHPIDPHSTNNSSVGDAYSAISQYGWSGNSYTVEWHGVMPGSDCTVGSNGKWTALPDASYFNNRHVWYYSKDNSPNVGDYSSAPAAATQDDGLQSFINTELN